MKRHYFCLFAVLLLLECIAPARAQSIAVVVNGKPITDIEVNQRQRLLSLSSNEKGSRSAAVEELIDEQLKMQEAKKYSVTVSDEQVDKAIGQISSRSKLSSDQFRQALQQRGVDIRTLRDRLQAEIAWTQTLQRRPRAPVRERDVFETMKQRGQNPDTVTSYEFQYMQAVVFVPKGETAAGRRGVAESFRAKAQDCDHVREAAKQFRDAAARGPLYRNGNEIAPALRTMLENTAIGHATPVQQTETGFEFAVMCSKKPISGREGAAAAIRQELTVKTLDENAKAALQDLRSRASIMRR